MSTASPHQVDFSLPGLIGAILVPGLGHFLRGEKRRAAMIATSILGLFFGGILIGGIDAIDSREDPFWFYGQALVGPLAFGVDYLHQNQFKVVEQTTSPNGKVVVKRRSARPDEGRDPKTNAPTPLQAGAKPPNIKGLAKVNEIGTLFATIGGMLNVIVVLDAALAPRGRARRDNPMEPHA
ncbi:MAG: DUF6677 family protein [Planctomycetota bacterium]|nr:DUF6677 family protein [Planctomycetota bacterium]